MKRIRILGLCLMAACAFAAVSVASSASAAEFGQCVAKKKSKYTESGCKTVAEKKGKPDNKGGYEFEPADSCYSDPKKGNFTEAACKTVAEKKGKPDHKGGFEAAPSPTFTTTSKTVKLITEGEGTVECTSSTGEGVIESGTKMSTITTFKGCSTDGQPCGNISANEIQTSELSGTLGEPTTGVAENVVTPKSAAYVDVFYCEHVIHIRTAGSVGGVMAPTDSTGTTKTFTFEKGVDQSLASEFSPNPAFPVGETSPPIPSEQVGALTVTETPAQMVHVG